MLFRSRNDGFRIILIDAGGDIRVGDPPPSLGGWRINLEDAVKGSSRLLLQGCAVATSGDKYKFCDIQGTRYSHIVNPVTGRGMTDHRQVTIIAGDGITADALATALSVMDIRAGLALAESLPGVQALIRVLNPEQAASGTLAGDTASAETFIVYRPSGFPGLA